MGNVDNRHYALCYVPLVAVYHLQAWVFFLVKQQDLFASLQQAAGSMTALALVESIFGGVTQRLLQESPVPLFLKH